MKKSTKKALRRIRNLSVWLVVGVVGTANLAIFAFQWRNRFFHESSYTPTLSRQDYLDTSLVVLQCILAAITILLAILAFFGYTTLRAAAETRAEETVREVVPGVAQQVADEVARRVAETYMALLSEQIRQREYDQTPTTEVPPPPAGTPESEAI